MSAPSVLREYLRFLGREKKYWLVPLALVLLLIVALVVLLESSSQDPFIYAIF